ncbi:MAG: DUF3769 domain-containing protein, partial [Cyanobacteria bacterium]|nr:DUF3769 domain-containing protein [Cyanobacteriota bacterium]
MDLAGTSHRAPPGERPLRRLAHQLVTAACLSTLFATEALATDVHSQPEAVNSADSINSVANFAVIRADQQVYDQQLGRLVAIGNVEARFNGWRLLADRVELAEASRSIYASGQIRLIKGDQYLQASRLRYSHWEGSGELDDVYGVIDQDTLASDVNSQDVNSLAPIANTNKQPSGFGQPGFACPPLSADPGNRSLVQVLPPGRTNLPTMPTAASCPGSELSTPALSLSRALESVAFGPPGAGGPHSQAIQRGSRKPVITAAEINQLPKVDSKVSNVTYQQSLSYNLKLDLGAVIDTTNSLNSKGQGYRPPKDKKGTISRIRFQGNQIKIQGNRWTAEQIAFTNDPFAPAASWMLARKVVAVMDGRGVTRINSRNTQILLDSKVSLPAITNTTIGEEESRFVLNTDKEDRNGFFLGYNLDPLKLGKGGSLKLQPQLNVQRAIEGLTSSYVLPGQSLANPASEQTAEIGDMFGMQAALNLPIGRLSLDAEASLSTFKPDNFRSGTRSKSRLTAPLKLPGHTSANADLFSSYRERIYNGSLGLQTIVYSYGANLSGKVVLNQPKALDAPRKAPFFTPVNLDWAAQSGAYEAALFETNELVTLWRNYTNLTATTTLQLLQGSVLDASKDPKRGLRYAAVPVVPGLAIDFGARGYAATYSDGANQSF